MLQVLHAMMCRLEHLSVDYMLTEVTPFVRARVTSTVTNIRLYDDRLANRIICDVPVDLLRGSRWRLQIVGGLDLRRVLARYRSTYSSSLHRLPVVEVGNTSTATILIVVNWGEM